MNLDNWEITGKARMQGLVVIISHLRLAMQTNGRIRVTGQNIHLYSENVQVTKLAKLGTGGTWVA